MTDQIGVIGAGAWGTTLAVLLADAQRPVSLWTRSAEAAEKLAHERTNERYLPGVVFPPNLRVATDDAFLAEPHRFFVLATPSAHLRGTLRGLATTLHPDAALLSVVKGIEEGTHLRMSEVAVEELPGRHVAALSGPNLAREIAAGKPAGSVVASEDGELAAELASVLSSDRFRVYTNPDLTGVELAGALKNVVALAAGMVDGLGFGDSAKAGIITRGPGGDDAARRRGRRAAADVCGPRRRWRPDRDVHVAVVAKSQGRRADRVRGAVARGGGAAGGRR